MAKDQINQFEAFYYMNDDIQFRYVEEINSCAVINSGYCTHGKP